MRCPKCHYLSFEPEPRCKNCGYDLSFSPGDLLDAARAEPEEDGPATPLRAVELEPEPEPEPERRAAPVEPPAAARLPPSVSALGSAITPVSLPMPAAPPPAAAPATTTELPLFVQALSNADPEPLEDRPLVRVPAAPRPPLAVRRNTPAPGRVRDRYHRHVDAPHQPELLQDRDVLDSAELHPTIPSRDVPEPAAPVRSEISPSHEHAAGAIRRIEAALVDLLFLGAINIAVVWLTLQQCQLTLAEIGALPLLPVAAFLFVLDSGYLLMFTATNGQTVGKMAAGIRVVSDPADEHFDRVTLRQAGLRAVLTFPSVLAFGLGFIPALLGEGLALHDRFTHTRVVRA